MKAATIFAMLFAAPAAYAQAGDHNAEVATFARIMADVRTEAEGCQGLSPDWTLVNAQKERLHVADVDYFAFRKQAHDRTEVLEQRFKAEHGPAGWCSDVFGLYDRRAVPTPDFCIDKSVLRDGRVSRRIRLR